MAIPDETIGQVNAMDLEIRDVRPHELSVAAAVLSRGMRDNPLHLSLFGPEPEERERKLEHFFRILLAWCRTLTAAFPQWDVRLHSARPLRVQSEGGARATLVSLLQ